MKCFKIPDKAGFAFPILIIFLMSLSVRISAASEINITIHKNTEITKDEILLGDVGDIKGKDRALVQKIERIVIGKTFVAGKSLKIERDQVLIRLKQNAIDITKVNLTVPKTAAAERAALEISSEELKRIVINFLNKKLPWDRNKVNLADIRINNNVVLPAGSITYVVDPPKNTEYLGITPLSIDFSVNGQFKKKVWVVVDIEVFSEVVVTKKPLGRYKLITEEDIRLVNMNLADLTSNVITRCEDVLGKRAKRAIDSNIALRPDLVEFPFLVNRGDIVLIIAESDGLKVTALGKVKEKGRKGEMVRVENIDSSKGIYARVLDSNSVKVDY